MTSPEESKPTWRQQLDEIRQRRAPLSDQIHRQLLYLMHRRGLIPETEIRSKFYAILGIQTKRSTARKLRSRDRSHIDALNDMVAEHAARLLSEEELTHLVSIAETREAALEIARVAESPHSHTEDVIEKVRRYCEAVPQDQPILSDSEEHGTRVALIRRLISDQLEFVSTAKKYLSVHDFGQIVDHIVPSVRGTGKFGGKGAGLLLAGSILERAREAGEAVGDVAIPRSFFLLSDSVIDFVAENDLEEFISIKYRSIDEIRLAFPIVERVFQNAQFPEKTRAGFRRVLDELGENPVIVRSSSLLEDRVGSPFSGKYRSIFLTNQGTIEERLDALLEATAEVYASTFGPDPIHYRSEKGLLDFQEEMAIIIEEVVGRRMGRYFLPIYSGVAFSRCEMRWSPRIKREDGMARLVMGLGTRAVDRTGDDFPTLVVLAQPQLKAAVRPDEIAHYAQKWVDVIDLEAGGLITIPLTQLIEECGRKIKGLHQLVSIYRDNHMSAPTGVLFDYDPRELHVTFDGLLGRTPFAQQMRTIMRVLEDALGFPVDIEFAHDGEKLHLVQCRSQSEAIEKARVPLPHIPAERQVFSASRYVNTAQVYDIEYVVYIDPIDYEAIETYEGLVAIGRCVGQLNEVLPARKFILMGPGRWGSRGDIRLGVRVTYSDINRTSLLIEIARKKGDYSPEVSFGTHFFQDLVESGISYLPLYPDDDGIVFNEEFLRRSPNKLAELAPQWADLAHVVRVIHVPEATEQQRLHIVMDGEEDEALAFIDDPREAE